MTPALLGRLEDAISRIEANAGNSAEADRWDREFHLLLLEACGNRVLQVFSAALVTYFEKTTENLPQNDPQFFLDIAKNERLLLTTIKAGRRMKPSAPEPSARRTGRTPSGHALSILTQSFQTGRSSERRPPFFHPWCARNPAVARSCALKSLR